MHVMITSRCNMRCAHCGMSCTTKGEDMTLETFMAALQHDDTISLGGGEPTLHPLFWHFLGLAIGTADSVWLATNGSQTQTAIALARMARKGVIGCALSQDIYHDPIDPKVIDAFTPKKTRPDEWLPADRNQDYREIRNVTGREIKAGRCKTGEIECICPEVYVRPNGDVHLCGCARSPKIGDVFKGYEIPERENGEWYQCVLEMRKDRRRIKTKGEPVAA